MSEEDLPSDNSSYYPLFDWLRIVLASVVCLQHARLIGWDLAGNFAVQVFYVLSGWLIGGLLLESTASDLPRFFFNRVTRIWIPYALALAIFYTVAGFRLIDVWWAKTLFFDLTFTHNLFAYYPDFDLALQLMPLKATARHFLSISVEEQFYLVAPFVILFLPLGRSWCVWLCAALVSAYLEFNSAAICFGVTAAILAASHPRFLARSGIRLCLAFALAVLAFGLYRYPDQYFRIAPMAAVPIVLLLAVPGGRGRIGAVLGAMSYPLYLNHWVGIYTAHAVQNVTPLKGEFVGELMGYVLALFLAAVVYLVVDRTIMKERAAFFTARRGRLCLAASVALLSVGLVGGLIASIFLSAAGAPRSAGFASSSLGQVAVPVAAWPAAAAPSRESDQPGS